MNSAFRGESTLLSTIMLIGVALILGVGILAYVSTTITSYRQQVDLVNVIRRETSNVFVNLVFYDNQTSTLWLIFKRLDGLSTNYLVIAESSGVYLNCSRIAVYNPLNDTDGILCNKDQECIPASIVYTVKPQDIKAVLSGGVVDFNTYLRAQRLSQPTGPLQVCRVINVCALMSTSGICRENTIVRVNLTNLSLPVRIYVLTELGGELYVVYTYEVM